MKPTAYRFGTFELDVLAHELRRDGAALALQPQPYRALALLVRRAGEVVTPEEFIAELWPAGTHVDFERGIISTIRRLREALDDSVQQPRYILTVVGHGYRFIAPVEAVGGAGGRAPGEVLRSRDSDSTRALRATMAAAGLVAAALLAVVITTTVRGTAGATAEEGAAGPVYAELVDSEVAEAFLRARHAELTGTEEALIEAAEGYALVTAAAPDFAPGWVGLATSQAAQSIWYERPPDEVLTSVRAATRRALELDPELADAHATEAMLALYFDWDWRAAGEALARAQRARTPSGRTYAQEAAYQTVLGQHDRAIFAARRAQALDPLSAADTAGVGWFYLYGGRPRAAIEHCRRTYELAPGLSRGKDCLIHAYEVLQQFDEAFDELAFYARPYLGEERFAELAALPADVAIQRYWTNLFEGWARLGTRPWRTAAFAALAGRNDEAVFWLRRAFEHRSPQLVFLHVDPRFAGLHPRPDFQALLRDMGLPHSLASN